MYTLIVENKYGEQLELTHNPKYSITEVDGLYPPEATINTNKNANVDGSVYNSSYLNDRQITITLAVNSPAETNRLELYKYFKTKYPIRLYYKNSTRDVYIDGYVQKMTVEYFSQKQTVQIVIDCPMALFNAREETIEEMLTVERKFRFPFSIKNPIPFSILTLAKETNIINHGDVETGMLIKLLASGAVKNPKIYNAQTLERIVLNVQMQAGDEIDINTRMKEKSIRLLRDGEQINVIGTLQASSSWFKLSPGDNLFTYEADEGVERLQCIFIINNQFEGV
nr:MAG TPA: tail protein [Caudoviricetes sp.]